MSPLELKITQPDAVRDDVPRHLGIIPDGNRRWAKDHGLPVAKGFLAGARRIPGILRLCSDRGIEFVSLWMLSESNLRRPAVERAAMIELAEWTITVLAERRQWRLQLIGQLDLLPPSTRDSMRAAVATTEDVDGPVVNLALGYTGRNDITTAVRSLLLSPDARRSAGAEIAENLTPDQIRTHLSTGDQPDLDLVVRTSGEERLSGFMTWQIAESELYFSPRLWPDFDESDFDAAMESYRDRDRRFGI
ncbi:polyprenyl diphosphate synthase [Lentzea sp. NPDC051838]|uniref:polyprenyl diphosphate synthase n=1 Tax=Lentzea sp. NPDC051838 TaxID=3154849 RepID=UPI003429167B